MTARILALYDKVHLVPFGEYLPLERYLERLGLQNLGKIAGGFLSGDRRRLIAVRGTPPMLPLICYEAIFPGRSGAARQTVRAGSSCPTNDGWFGMSSGPYQHFQQARVLAIEEGLPLVHAANTGISAVIDPLGRILQSLPLGTRGAGRGLAEAYPTHDLCSHRQWSGGADGRDRACRHRSPPAAAHEDLG